jgi:hypothetical protein
VRNRGWVEDIERKEKTGEKIKAGKVEGRQEERSKWALEVKIRGKRVREGKQRREGSQKWKKGAR